MFLTICMKMDLALNNLQMLIYHCYIQACGCKKNKTDEKI